MPMPMLMAYRLWPAGYKPMPMANWSTGQQANKLQCLWLTGNLPMPMAYRLQANANAYG
jgi:hypothetical protein